MIDPTGGPGAAGQGDPTTVYDNGPRLVKWVGASNGLNNSGATLIAAAPGLRTKIIYWDANVTAFTTAGVFWLRDGAGSVLFLMGTASANNLRFVAELSGIVIATGSVNTTVDIFCSGNVFIYSQVGYYQAP